MLSMMDDDDAGDVNANDNDNAINIVEKRSFCYWEPFLGSIFPIFFLNLCGVFFQMLRVFFNPHKYFSKFFGVFFPSFVYFSFIMTPCEVF